MTENLPVPAPFVAGPAQPTIIDIRRALSGIQPGWYRSADLLPRYNAWAEQNGRPQTNARLLGIGIRHGLTPESRNLHGNLRAWNLTADHLSGVGPGYENR